MTVAIITALAIIAVLWLAGEADHPATDLTVGIIKGEYTDSREGN